MKLILTISILIVLITSCVNTVNHEKESISINSSTIINNCVLYGHKNRIDGFTGATKLITKPTNKNEKIIAEILNLPELNNIQLKITESGSHDFVAISYCDLSRNPFKAECLIDNFYKDSTIFDLEIDTLKMTYRIIN